MRYILDEEGKPQPEPNLLKWAVWFENPANRRVAHTVIEGVEISTVFLAIDHGFGEIPILWESMIFGGPLNGEQLRYSSREEALDGHNLLVSKVAAFEVWPEEILAD